MLPLLLLACWRARRLAAVAAVWAPWAGLRHPLPLAPSAPHPAARSIQTYLQTRGYLRPPEGREMPQFDASSYDRA